MKKKLRESYIYTVESVKTNQFYCMFDFQTKKEYMFVNKENLIDY